MFRHIVFYVSRIIVFISIMLDDNYGRMYDFEP